MAKSRCKIGMGQIQVDGGQVEANLARAEQMIHRAAEAGCDMVVLPECSDLGWTYPGAAELAVPIPGSYSERICQAAAFHSVYVVIGLTEKDGDKIYNAAILVSPEGKILMKHRKINLCDIEQASYCTGDSLRVVETPLGTLGVNICADNFPNSLALGHSLARMGARMILSPCAWAVSPAHDNAAEPYGAMWKRSYTTLAGLYSLPVIGVSNVGWITGGPWDGDKCIGCSLAVGSNGEILAEGPYGVDAEALTVVETEIVPRPVTGAIWAEYLKKKGYEGP